VPVVDRSNNWELVLSWFKLLGYLGLLFSLLTSTQSATAGETNKSICPQNLPLALEAIINSPQNRRSRWGIKIQTQNSGETLYSLEADKYFIPASVVKLLTTAAALVELGDDFRIQTPVYAVGNAPNLTSLRIEGRGDPTLSVKSLKDLVHQLQELGIQSIEKLIVDDSYFSQPPINPTWEWSDVYSYYGTAVNSLILDRNTVTLTLLPQQIGKPVKLRWSNAIAARQWRVENNAVTAPPNTEYNVTINGVLGEPILQINGELALNDEPDIWDLAILNPANYFLESWWLVLKTTGIEVIQGRVIKGENNNHETQIATLISPKLSVILREINQKSDNLSAEVLLNLLQKKLNTDNRIDALEQTLTKLGLNKKDYVLVDGSGLSRQNLLTPNVLVKTLNLIANSKYATVYQNSLAVAGKNGTLKNRFIDTQVSGNLWGKTGTLTGAATLAGYLDVPEYETLVFSIMVNNSDLSSQEIRQAIDEIIILLSKLKPC
jgi:serine-type D-Ala-D-Ala carboxypeptidase/endopeptidase (penicillin-binding protein 4)